MRKLIMLIIVLSISMLLNSQIIESAFRPELFTPSFLNPDNLSINHSIRFMGGVSSDNQSYYESVYTNHLTYRLNPKLNLKLDLNFVNFGTASYKSGIEFEGNNDNESKILPNFQLNWRPSQNTSITIEYKQYHNPWDFYHRW